MKIKMKMKWKLSHSLY